MKILVVSQLFHPEQFRINDIVEAINKIQRYTHCFNFESWRNDEKTVDVVIRNLEVIGEASSHLPIKVQEQYENVTWGMMKGIRNILAHEYFGISLPIIWDIVQNKLDELSHACLRLTSESPDKSKS